MEGRNGDRQTCDRQQQPHCGVGLMNINTQGDNDQDDIANQNTGDDKKNHRDPRELKSRIIFDPLHLREQTDNQYSNALISIDDQQTPAIIYRHWQHG